MIILIINVKNQRKQCVNKNNVLKNPQEKGEQLKWKWANTKDQISSNFCN